MAKTISMRYGLACAAALLSALMQMHNSPEVCAALQMYGFPPELSWWLTVFLPQCVAITSSLMLLVWLRESIGYWLAVGWCRQIDADMKSEDRSYLGK